MSTLLPGLEDNIDRAAQALMRRQRDDGHWVFELEADATIPSEYVLLRHYLGEPDDLELERKIAVYLRRIQGEHGGWPLFHDGAFDVSASVKAYFCLKMIGDSPDAPHMAKAPNPSRQRATRRPRDFARRSVSHPPLTLAIPARRNGSDAKRPPLSAEKPSTCVR